MRYYVTRRESAWAIDPSGAYVLRRETDFKGMVLLAPTPDPRAWPCLLAYDTPFNDPDYYDLGDNLGLLPDSVATALSNRFSIAFPDKRFDRILAQLLMQEGRVDGSRWRNLRPSKRRGRYEIWLGGLAWTIPYIAGGTSISESFDTADSDTLGPDLSWTEASGDIDIVSNAAAIASINDLRCEARAGTSLASDDHYSQIIVTGLTVPGDSPNNRTSRAAVITRFAAAARTFYYGNLRRIGPTTSVDDSEIYVVSAGTYTRIGGPTSLTISPPHTIKLTSDGSSHTLAVDGVDKIGPITNTTIVDNLQVGFAGQRRASGDTVTMDSFTAADLAAPAARRIMVVS